MSESNLLSTTCNSDISDINQNSDLILSNQQKLEVEPTSNINFYESGIGNPVSAIRFHSGSDSNGTKWINMQPEPGGQGRMAIASFPENNHFMFFDPKDSVVGNQRVYIEATIEGGDRGGPVSIGDGLVVTGSVSISSVMRLSPQDPLPRGTIGDMAVSGSNLFFYNGNWSQII